MAKKRHNKDRHHAATAATQQEAHAVGDKDAALVEDTNSDDVGTPGSTETVPDDERTALPSPPEGDASASEEEEEEEEQQPLMMPPAPVHPPQFTERPLMMPPAPVHPPQFTERPLNPAIVVPTRVEVPPPIRKRTTPTSSSSSSAAPSYVPVASLMASSTSATKAPPTAGKNHLTLTACLIALSSFLWGYTVSVLNVCIVPDAVGSLLVDINLTTEEQETATALVLVGALLSALLSGGLGQRMGLKTVILLNNVFFLAGGAACALAVTKRAIFLGRFSIGLACGVVTNTVPILLNEISPLAMRGRITSYHQLMLTIGILATGIFGWLIVEDVPSGWRYLNGFIIVPALLQLIMVSWIPESPYWLMKFKGKDQSRRTLMRLRDPHNRDAIEAELSEIALTMETNAVARSAEWSDLWEYKSVLLMVFFQAMTGINTVMLYSAKIFHFAGVTNPFLATVVVGVTNVLVTVLSVALVDSHGRRPLLLSGTLLMIGSLLVLSGSLLWLNDSLHWQAVLAVSAVLLFVAGFAVGLGAVVWVVLADITPVEIRSRAFSLFMGISYVCNILIAVYTLSAINYLGRGPNPEKDGIAKLYLILAGVAAAALLFISYRLPETSTPAAQAARAGGVMSEEHSALLLPQDEQDEYDRNTTEL